MPIDPIVTFIVPTTTGHTKLLRSLLKQTNPLWAAKIGFYKISKFDINKLSLPNDPRITYTSFKKRCPLSVDEIKKILAENVVSDWFTFIDNDISLEPESVDILLEDSFRTNHTTIQLKTNCGSVLNAVKT